MKRRWVGATVLLAVVLAGVTVFAGTSKTAHSYDNPFRSDDDRHILNWAGYELPNNWNMLMKDVDTLFSKATGMYPDSIYKTAVKAIRVRADSGTIPILTGSVAIRTNVTADSGRSAKAWSAPRIRGDSAVLPILTGNVVVRGTLTVGTVLSTVANPTGKYSVGAGDMAVWASANDSAQYLDTITLPALSANDGRLLILGNASDGDTAIIVKPTGADKIDGNDYDTLIKAKDVVTYVGDVDGGTWRLVDTHTH